jgi:hypothetical protein
MTRTDANLVATPEGSDPELRLGTFLGNWRLDSLLLADALSSLYVASNRAGDVSLMRVYERGGEAGRLAFREASLLRMLAGPGIPALIVNDVTAKGEPYVVFEAIAGADVSALCDVGRAVEPAAALHMVSGLLQVADRAHRQGVILVALGVQNVRIGVDGSVAVVDVRWCRELGAAASDGVWAAGLAPEFAVAPEVQASGAVSFAADVYVLARLTLSLMLGVDTASMDRASLQEAMRGALGRIDRVWLRDFIAGIASSLDPDVATREPFTDALHTLLAQSEPPRPSKDPVESLQELARDFGHTMAGAVHRGWRSAAALQELFDQVERVLFSIRRSGWQHPSVEQGIQDFTRALLAIVGDDPDGVRLDVHAWQFVSHERPIWVPAHPFDRIPYHLFAAGFRSIRILPGVDFDECQRFVRWLLVDPAQDLASEDDMATAWWSNGFVNVRADMVSSVVLSELDEYDALERELRSLRVLAVDEARGRLRARLSGGWTAASPESLPPPEVRPRIFERDAVMTDMGNSLDGDPELLMVRMGELVGRVHALAQRTARTGFVRDAFHAWVTENLREARVRPVLETIVTMGVDVPESEMAEYLAMLDHPEPMHAILTFLDQCSTDYRPAGLQTLQHVLTFLSDRVYTCVTTYISGLNQVDLLQACASYVLDGAANRGPLLGELLRTASITGANLLCDALRKVPADIQSAALMEALESSELDIRMMGLEELLMMGQADAARYLARLVDGSRPERRRAIQAAVEAGNPLSIEVLGVVAGRRDFVGWPLQDRHQLLSGLFSLDGRRAEQLTIELLAADRIIADPDHEQTRILCAELLAELGGSASLQELQRQARRLITSSAELQRACARAATRLESRLGV